jgi:hypothetical protein
MFVIYKAQYLDYKFCKLYVASYPHPADFFCGEISPFCYKEKVPSNMVKGNSWKFYKRVATF